MNIIYHQHVTIIPHHHPPLISFINIPTISLKGWREKKLLKLIHSSSSDLRFITNQNNTTSFLNLILNNLRNQRPKLVEETHIDFAEVSKLDGTCRRGFGGDAYLWRALPRPLGCFLCFPIRSGPGLTWLRFVLFFLNRVVIVALSDFAAKT
jgi:hypothetical protein